MKVFVYSSRPFDKPVLSEVIGKAHKLFFTDQKLNSETAHLADGCEAVALFTSDDASAAILDQLYTYGIRYVALRSVGFDHVNLEKAAELGMHVANVPEYSPYSVAEHAVTLLLAANRKIIESQQLMQLQDFRLDTLSGFDVHGKTVGVIGTGNIGMAFSKIMKGFGATILASDPVQNPKGIELGIHYVPLEKLLRESDIVSVHCPLNEKTRYLLSEEQFLWMKKNAVLINTSRGGIINSNDLIRAISQGRFKAVCLDVYEKEKGVFFEDHRTTILTDDNLIKLQSFRNVLITGHQGFLTEEALLGIANTTLLNLNFWQQKQHSPNELQKLLKHEKMTV